MPVYEFECQDCGEIFEVICIKSQTHADCPECRGLEKPGRGRRILSAANFAIKGYSTKNNYSERKNKYAASTE